MLVPSAAFAEPCGAGIEDFFNFVTGDDECLALEFFNRKALKNPKANLIIGVHGDGGPGELRNFFRSLDIRGSENLAAVNLLRPGFSTTYNNDGPGTAARRTSTGYKTSDGSNTYTKANIISTMSAINRLIEHYDKRGNTTVVAKSGGAAMVEAGNGLLPALAIPKAIFIASPCNLDAWAKDYDGWKRSYTNRRIQG